MNNLEKAYKNYVNYCIENNQEYVSFEDWLENR